MKTVYSAPNIALVTMFKDLLEAQGIECLVRNDMTGAGSQLQPIEFWPELCVKDEDYAEAARLVEEAQAGERGAAGPWKCGSCGEELEGQFTECWNCGRSR
jgi:hypothetical protein